MKVGQLIYRVKEVLFALCLGLLMGVGIIAASHFFGQPIPPRENQRGIFLVGISLFSVLFRMVMMSKAEQIDSPRAPR